MNSAAINPQSFIKINKPKYIKLKLYITYSVIFVFFMLLGATVCALLEGTVPSSVYNDMVAFFIAPEPENSIIKIISSIIFNALDIFKISIIIILSGFSYIPRPISKITAAVWSVWCGSSFFYCTHIIEHPAINTKTIILIVIVTLFYCSIFISNCVRSELAAQELSSFRNSKQLFSSNVFWKYIGNFLISFGYILTIYTVYIFLFNLLK